MVRGNLTGSAGVRPKLSVLVFTYNRQRMLAQCLDSILPTGVDCEIAVFDDASTDGTPDLVRSYAERDARIRYFRQPRNVGLSANYGVAEKEARGELVTIIADDDSVEPGNYERKVAILDANPHIGIVYSLAYMTDEHLLNRQVHQRVEYLDHSYIGGRAEFADLISGNYIAGNSVVFRRSLMEQHGLMDSALPATLSDWELWLCYAFHAETAFINEPLVNVRLHSGGASSQTSSDMAMGMISVWWKWLVDRKEPPALDKRTWERMHAVFASEVQRLHGGEPAKAETCLAAFEQLRKAAAANASQAFARRTRCIMPVPDRRTTASLIWAGPVQAVGGIASDLRGMALAAEAAAGLSLRLEDLNWGLANAEPPTGEQRRRLRAAQWRPLPPGIDHIHVWQGPLDYPRADDEVRVRVARLALESEAPSPLLLEKAADLEALWLPNQFQCDVLREHGIPAEKLKVLPGCVDTGNEDGAAKIDLGTGRSFNFLSMVQLNDSALEVVLRAFAREFRPNEDVALVLVVRVPPGLIMEQVVAEVRRLVQLELGNAQEIPPINLRLGAHSEGALAGLLAASQAYVEPRPTTWGRGVLEAMARSVPVVGARVGANVGLLSVKNSFTITSETTPETLGGLMRQARSAPDEAGRRGVRAQAAVTAEHSPAAVGQRLRELIEELQTDRRWARRAS